jgi:pyruvate formate lyase activating enzyme
VLSFGTAGCNLTCKFCQNWDISKARELDRLQDKASPEDIVRAAIATGSRCIAYTYNDPTIFLEYAVDVAKIARQHGIRNVAVTAGYIAAAAREHLYAWMDAANVDLKAFTEAFYKRLCTGHLGAVLETLEYLKH